MRPPFIVHSHIATVILIAMESQQVPIFRSTPPSILDSIMSTIQVPNYETVQMIGRYTVLDPSFNKTRLLITYGDNILIDEAQDILAEVFSSAKLAQESQKDTALYSQVTNDLMSAFSPEQKQACENDPEMLTQLRDLVAIYDIASEFSLNPISADEDGNFALSFPDGWSVSMDKSIMEAARNITETIAGRDYLRCRYGTRSTFCDLYGGGGGGEKVRQMDQIFFDGCSLYDIQEAEVTRRRDVLFTDWPNAWRGWCAYLAR
jgi:hypothetical protein